MMQALRLAAMHRVLASWFGTGLILGRARGNDLGSGTVGSIFAFPIAVGIGSLWGWPAQVIAALVVIGFSLWAVTRLPSSTGDAGWIVIDEAAGTFIAVIGLGLWPGAVVALVVFRAADIFKRFFPGVAEVERLSGTFGITADDVIAGAYGLIAGHIVQWLI